MAKSKGHKNMIIWVDADSFPRECKDLLERAAKKRGLTVVFVANKKLKYASYSGQTDAGTYFHQVESGAGIADEFILSKAQLTDIVLTRDLPLAASLVEKSVTTINDRGTIFSAQTISERLSQRDFMAHLRDSGLASDGGRSYGKKEYQAFAQCLDRAIMKLTKTSN